MPNPDSFSPSTVIPAKPPHSKLRITLRAQSPKKHNMPCRSSATFELHRVVFCECDHTRALHGPTSGPIWVSMGPLPPRAYLIFRCRRFQKSHLGTCYFSSPPSLLSFAHTAGSSGSLTHFRTFPFVFCFFVFSFSANTLFPPIPRGSCFRMELQRLIQSSFDPFLPNLRLASMGTRCFFFFYCSQFFYEPVFFPALCSDTPFCIPPPFVFRYLRRFVIFCNFQQRSRSL